MLPLGRRYDLMGEEFRARNMLKEAQLRIGSMSASKQRLEEHMRRMKEGIAALKKEQEELKARQEELKEIQESRRTRMQEDPSMRALQGILADLGKGMNELYEKVRTFGSLREASENDRGELEKIAARLDAGEKELASLQKEYDELKEKYTEYAGRYKQWTDRKDTAISMLDRLRNEIASVDAPMEESEDAEEAFRRMMED